MARTKKEPEIIEPTGELYVEPLDKVLHSSMLPYAEFVGKAYGGIYRHPRYERLRYGLRL